MNKVPFENMEGVFNKLFSLLYNASIKKKCIMLI